MWFSKFFDAQAIYLGSSPEKESRKCDFYFIQELNVEEDLISINRIRYYIAIQVGNGLFDYVIKHINAIDSLSYQTRLFETGLNLAKAQGLIF